MGVVNNRGVAGLRYAGKNIMATKREAVLKAIESATEEPEQFMSLLKKNVDVLEIFSECPRSKYSTCFCQASRTSEFSVAEFLQGLPRGQLERLCKGLLELCQWCAGRFEDGGGEETVGNNEG